MFYSRAMGTCPWQTLICHVWHLANHRYSSYKMVFGIELFRKNIRDFEPNENLCIKSKKFWDTRIPSHGLVVLFAALASKYKWKEKETEKSTESNLHGWTYASIKFVCRHWGVHSSGLSIWNIICMLLVFISKGIAPDKMHIHLVFHFEWF